MKKYQNILLGLLSSVLMTLSYPPYPFSLLAFIGLVPVLFAVLEMKKWRFSLLYLVFFLFNAGTLWWVGSWQQDADTFLMVAGAALSIVHPFFFLVPFALMFMVQKKFGTKPAILAFPFFWTAFEYAHSLGDLAFPWLSLGYSQTLNFHWIQFVDITGVWGASFLIVLINILFLNLIYKLRLMSGENLSLGQKLWKVKDVLTIIALFFIIPMAYSFIILDHYSSAKLVENNKLIKCGIIQPNINSWKKWKSDVSEQIIFHQKLQDSLNKAVVGLDLAVWSETAIPFLGLYFNAQHNFDYLQKWLDSTKVTLVTGFSEFKILKESDEKSTSTRKMKNGETYETFNSSLMLNPSPYTASNPQLYYKMKLTPFSERFPYMELLSFAKGWFEWGVGISSWGLGEIQKPLYLTNDKLGKVGIGTIICIESIHPSFVANFTNEGASLLTLITNDGWYDHTFGPRQHYIIAQMRAMECRRYICRCANTGISGFIAATGESVYEAPQYTSTAIALSVPTIDNITFFAEWGDWFPHLCSAASLLLIIFSFFKRKE